MLEGVECLHQNQAEYIHTTILKPSHWCVQVFLGHVSRKRKSVVMCTKRRYGAIQKTLFVAVKQKTIIKYKKWLQ